MLPFVGPTGAREDMVVRPSTGPDRESTDNTVRVTNANVLRIANEWRLTRNDRIITSGEAGKSEASADSETTPGRRELDEEGRSTKTLSLVV